MCYLQNESMTHPILTQMEVQKKSQYFATNDEINKQNSSE